MKRISQLFVAVIATMLLPSAAQALYCPTMQPVGNAQVGSGGKLVYHFVANCSSSDGYNAYPIEEKGVGTWLGNGAATEVFDTIETGNPNSRQRTELSYACDANPWGNNSANCQAKSCQHVISSDGGKKWLIPGGDPQKGGCKSSALGKAQPTTRHLIASNAKFGSLDPNGFRFVAPADNHPLSFASSTCFKLELDKTLLESMNVAPNTNGVIELSALMTWIQPNQIAYQPWAGAKSALPTEIRLKGIATSSPTGEDCVYPSMSAPAKSALAIPGQWTVRACLNVALKGGGSFQPCTERKIQVPKTTASAKDSVPTGPMQAIPALPPLPPPGAGSGGSGSGQGALPVPPTIVPGAPAIPPSVAPRSAPAAPGAVAPAPPTAPLRAPVQRLQPSAPGTGPAPGVVPAVPTLPIPGTEAPAPRTLPGTRG